MTMPQSDLATLSRSAAAARIVHQFARNLEGDVAGIVCRVQVVEQGLGLMICTDILSNDA